MSWTSEHDPPASRASNDEPIDDGEPFDLDDLPDVPMVRRDPVDDEDGPLDPSVFDGLFDDLVEEPTSEADDNPLDAFLTGPLTDDADTEIVDLSDDESIVDRSDGESIVDRSDGESIVDRLAQEHEPRAVDGSFATAEAEPGVDGPAEAPATSEETARVEIDLPPAGQPSPPAMPIRGKVEPPHDGQDPEMLLDDLADIADQPDAFDDELLLSPAEADQHRFHRFDGFDGFDDDDLDLDRPGPIGEGQPDHGTAPIEFENSPPATPPSIERSLVADGPLRASPPIQHDPSPEPDYGGLAAVAGEAVPKPIADQRPRRTQRILAALAVAIVTGGGLGVAGAMLLSRLVDEGETTPATATGTDEGAESAAATDVVTPGQALGAATSLGIASLRFEPGGPSPSLTPSTALDLLADAIERDPSAAIVATVRTFTEPTAAQDLALSAGQAEALSAQLVELGADPTRVAVVGLGRSLLTSAQPVPNFVVPSAGLDPSALSDVTRDVGPFAIGLDSTTGRLRAESVAALDALAVSMAADPERRGLTMAAYSFDQRDSSANERQAELAAAAATAHLTGAGIDPARLTTIVAGDEPFAVPDRVANHVDLHWGTLAAGHLAVAGLAVDQIDFAEGSADLGPQGGATIDQLGALLIELGGEVVVDVHSFDADQVTERVDLSVIRAQSIGQRLLAAGVPATQLRLHGGTSSQFRTDGRVSRVVVTWLQPPDRS